MTNNWLVSSYDVTPGGSNLNVGLIGQYRLNGNLNDSVGGNHGTKEGVGAAVYVAGMDGQAIDLDGIDDHVSTDVNAIDLGIDADAPKTVTAWAYTRSFNDGGIFDMGDNVNGRNYSLRTLGTTDIWRAQRYGYPTYDFDFEYDSLGKWVHFALVYGGPAAGDMSWAYADGNLVGSQIAAMDTGTARNFEIGVWSGNYFDGLIDEVRVYNRALTQAEAASLAGRSATFTQIMYPLIDPMDADSGAVDMNGDNTIDLKDYALLADTFLDELLWPTGAPPTVDADAEVACVILTVPSSSDTVNVLPTSVSSLTAGQDYYVEVWASDVGSTNTGLTSVYVDMQLSPCGVATITSIDHGGIFTVFGSGTIGACDVDELGGSSLTGAGIQPQWARVAAVKIHADASGALCCSLAQSSTGVAAFGRGTIAWPDVKLIGSCD